MIYHTKEFENDGNIREYKVPLHILEGSIARSKAKKVKEAF